jgi:hypothetical protein
MSRNALQRFMQTLANVGEEKAARQKCRCGAHARTTGKPCQAPAMPNGRCKLHGGMSTGPKTAAGRARIAAAQRARWSREREEGVTRRL